MSQIYSVRSGDTLTKVARQFNTTVDKLAKANNIANPNRIAVGQRLTIPDSFQSSPAPRPSATSYTVKSGDTLGVIAKRHGTTAAALARANNISNPNRIAVGQRLTIPGASSRPGDGFSPPAPAPSRPAPAPAAPSTGGSRSLAGVTVPTGTLRRGANGPAVRQLQQALVKTGHLSQANMNTGPGVFGPKTEAALKSFQSANRLTADGVYGPQTRAAFEKLGAKAAGSSGSAPVTGPRPEPGSGRGVTVGQLRQIMPNLSQAKAEQYLPHLNRAMAEANITTPKRQAAFIAQLAHESAQFRYMEEIASGAAYEGRRDLGNTQPGDGKRFKGRGPIQLTGRANYQAAGRALGIDLVNNPKRAADPDVGFRTAAWFWNTRNLNSYADAGNFREVTRRINGGYNGMADRQQYYNRALRVLGA